MNLQSTLAAELSKLLHLPLIKLDHIRWKPNRSWEHVTDEEFDAELWHQVKQHEKTGWVMDGNYRKHTRKVTEELVTDVVCKWALWSVLVEPPYSRDPRQGSTCRSRCISSGSS